MPGCELCNGAAMTVKHILIDCPNLRRHRQNYLGENVPITLKNVIGEEASLSNVIMFLKEINAYNLI